MFNYFINDNPTYPPDTPPESIAQIAFLRKIIIPETHAALTVMCFISSSDRIPWDGLKQGLNFLGMVLYV